MSRSIPRLIGLLLLTLACVSVADVQGQDAKPAGKAAPKGRLPPHYKDVVSEEQRAKIYNIQSTYNEDLDKLEEQLKALTAKRDAEIEAVLTADQKKKIEALKAEAATTKKKPAAATKTSAAKPVEATLTKPAAK